MAFGGENAESYFDEGLTAAIKGDLNLAVKHFDRAIRLDNTLHAAYHQLGKCYSRMGKHKLAVELLAQVIAKHKDQISARLDMGQAVLGLGNTAEARKQFEHVLSSNPVHGKALLGIAQVDFEEGNWAAAMSQAQAALVNSGSNFAVHYMLGRSAKLAGEPEVAKSALEKADALIEKSLEANPEKVEGHFLRGEVHFTLDQLSAAQEHYRAAEDRAKPDINYAAYGEHFTLADILAKEGLCYQRRGQDDRAAEMGKRAFKLDPNHAIAKTLKDL